MFDSIFKYLQRLRVRKSWDRRWGKRGFSAPWLAEKPRPFVLNGFEDGWLSPGVNLLEIGCGRGTTADWLAERGIQVIGIDLSRHAIDQARRLYPNRKGLIFQCADVCGDLTLERTFDVIIDTGCLQHIPQSLHKDYQHNLLLWSRIGTRFIVSMHTQDESASERRAQALKLFSPPFEMVHTEAVPAADSRVLKNPNAVFHFIRR